jgi:uncharacterized membrane protein
MERQVIGFVVCVLVFSFVFFRLGYFIGRTDAIEQFMNGGH